MSTFSESVQAAGAVLDKYSADLARAWREKPFQRVSLALSFAAGFNKGQPNDSDPHPDAWTVLTAAYSDEASRRVAAANSESVLRTAPTPYGFVLLDDGMPIASSETEISYLDNYEETRTLRQFHSIAVYNLFLQQDSDDPFIDIWIANNSAPFGED